MDELPEASAALLLYSLAELREIIFTGFGIAGVRSIMEVGAEVGGFTRHLTEWVGDHDGILYCVDPKPNDGVRRLAASNDRVELLTMTSHQALDELPPVDSYLLDGDHNYFTVTGELERIEIASRSAEHHPLIVAQDMDWPAGRRDQYYDPGALPAEAVHPYTFDMGVVPWSAGVDAHGFRSRTEFAWALEEGGPANGVRTAIDDFLRPRAGYRTIHLPCVFGLMFIFPAEAPWSDEMDARLGLYNDSPLLGALESGRIELYLAILKLNDELGLERLESANRVAEAEARLQDLTTELDITRQRLRAAQEGTSAELST
jgi:hypothetical protein